MRGGDVVLEGLALGGGQHFSLTMQVAHQAAFAVVLHAVAEDEVVHAPGDIDGVDLDVAMVGEGGGDVGSRRVEQTAARGA